MNDIVKRDKADLREMLEPFNISEKLYLLAIIRGYNENEAHDISKSLGTNIDRYLLEPVFSSMRQYIMDKGGGNKGEAEEYFRELISEHYMEMMILKGLEQLGKDNKDNTIVREATKCATFKTKRGKTEDESYDEMILKRHVKHE